MKKLLNLILGQSIKDLFKYKSFFLLVFVLILADRLIKQVTKDNRSGLELPEMKSFSLQVAQYLFEEFPSQVIHWLTDFRTLVILVLLFLLKQLISMWPSSDMRRMHREEREKFGLFASLFSIHGKQIVWDAIAVGSVVLITGIWVLVSFYLGYFSWGISHSIAALLLFGGLSGLIFPIAMAGFSFSSKLAVISKGTFKEKLILYFELFRNLRVLAGSWLFYLLRIIVEAIFVVILPLSVLWVMDNVVLRVVIAGLIATPVYSFLKMASFKFFLYIYKPYPLVAEEYQIYYHQ